MDLYLKNYQFILYQCLATFGKDCFSLVMSKGTLYNFTTKAYKAFGSFGQRVKANLLGNPEDHSNETRKRVQGKTKWMHLAGDNARTYYHNDTKIGREAIKQAGILSDYIGMVIHDRLLSYINNSNNQGLGNAHLLQDFIFLEGQGREWAREANLCC